MSLVHKIKFTLMAICPILVLYAAYTLYFKERFILSTLISMLATGVLIVMGSTNLKNKR